MATLRIPNVTRRAVTSLQSLRLHQTTPLTTSTSRLNPRIQPTRQPPSHLRPYHSTLHPRLPDHEYTNSQTAILTAALPHIPEHGFSLEALTLGARDAGFLDVSVQLLPRAEFDLILFWLASRRGILRAKVEEGALFTRVAAESGRDVAGLSVEEKSRILVLERLRMNVGIKDQWQDV
jgi:ubiquinone biosynthesis protein COQ9